MQITQIKINGVREPLGFGFDRPCVSFKVTDTASQKAVDACIRIMREDAPDQVLAERRGADLDHTGEHFAIPLEPRTAYRVQITVEGDAGDRAEAESRFETGKRGEPWQAEWIAAKAGDGCHPLMTKTVTVRPGLVKARLYATGAGMFEAYINGEKLGDEYLKPGITNYETRLQVVTFAVDSLREGENEVVLKTDEGLCARRRIFRTRP